MNKYKLSVPAFPSVQFPSETRHARLLGVYPQRQQGLWMQRVRIPGGILSAVQWHVLALAAKHFTPSTPLHLTTRQDLEFHDLAEQSVAPVQRMLAEAGLTSLGSGGDTLRNITVSPCMAGGTGESPDLLPLCRVIGQSLSEYEGIFSLPRKFKISLGCQSDCCRPFTHDLSFVAVCRYGRWGLKVIGAGSLGPKPETGIQLYEFIEPSLALPLSLAAVRLFDKTGDRQNRGRARFRHVRQRLGDEAFISSLNREFEVAKSERRWPKIELSSANVFFPIMRTLSFPNGDVRPDDAESLSVAAGRQGVSVRIGNDHRIYIYASDKSTADGLFASLPALAARAENNPRVVACPGTRWCGRALADTNNLADRIRSALAGQTSREPVITVSGCPNGCTINAAADIGVIGGKSNVDGQTVEKYILVSGGGKGATNILASPFASGLSADQTVEEIVRLACLPDRGELLELAELARTDPFALIERAYQVRVRHFGKKVRLCSIVPGKFGACSEDCKWCAQSARHGMRGANLSGDPVVTSTEEIAAAARAAAENGVGSLGIVNSGRRASDAEIDRVIDAVRRIVDGESAGSGSGEVSRFGACASLGAINADQAGRLAQAGVFRYHHNLETSRAFFPKVVGTHGYQERLDTLNAARQAGLKICSGGIFGLGESWADRIELAITLRDEVRPDCVPLNFLHPIEGTPLAGATPLPPLECLCIIALFRIAMPTTDLLVAGGRVSNIRDMQSWVFHAGATTLMTGDKYLTTCGRPVKQDLQMLHDLGYEVVRQF